MTHIGVSWPVLHCRKEAQTVSWNLISSLKVCASLLLFVHHNRMHWWRYKPVLHCYGLYIDIICSVAHRVANRVLRCPNSRCPDLHLTYLVYIGLSWRLLGGFDMRVPVNCYDIPLVALLYTGLFLYLAPLTLRWEPCCTLGCSGLRLAADAHTEFPCSALECPGLHWTFVACVRLPRCALWLAPETLKKYNARSFLCIRSPWKENLVGGEQIKLLDSVQVSCSNGEYTRMWMIIVV
jgi:hypothetical protein